MRYQEASIVVSCPLPEVQQRLSRVEDWPQFVNSVSDVERVSHERYRFRVIDPANQRERQDSPVVVRVDHGRHELRWRSLSGPRFTGCFSLRPVDDRHTEVKLALSRYPDRTVTAMMEWWMPRTQHAVVDLHMLDRYLSQAS